MFLKTLAVSTLTAMALALNLNSGRMDFALGATGILAVLISGKICEATGAGFGTLVLLGIALGLIFGGISGLLYVLFRLPSIVTSLGVMLIYEGLGAAVMDNKTFQAVITARQLTEGNSFGGVLTVLITALAVMIVILNYTKFGFSYRALQHGQIIAVNTGLDEKINACICYALGGALMTMAECLTMASSTITPALALSSSGVAFSAFLPLMIGGLLARWSETNIGILLGAVIASMLNLSLSALGVPGQVTSLVNAFILFAFLCYMIHEIKIVGAIKTVFKKIGGQGNVGKVM
jgi:ribose transport system permease protein